MAVNYISVLDELERYMKFSPSEEKELEKVVNIHPFKITDYYL
jgi:L-lysine 2,3-aminomutase